jgi:hypothetical protein
MTQTIPVARAVGVSHSHNRHHQQHDKSQLALEEAGLAGIIHRICRDLCRLGFSHQQPNSE